MAIVNNRDGPNEDQWISSNSRMLEHAKNTLYCTFRVFRLTLLSSAILGQALILTNLVLFSMARVPRPPSYGVSRWNARQAAPYSSWPIFQTLQGVHKCPNNQVGPKKEIRLKINFGKMHRWFAALSFAPARSRRLAFGGKSRSITAQWQKYHQSLHQFHVWWLYCGRCVVFGSGPICTNMWLT